MAMTYSVSTLWVLFFCGNLSGEVPTECVNIAFSDKESCVAFAKDNGVPVEECTLKRFKKKKKRAYVSN
jgi:hypothetical protein